MIAAFVIYFGETKKSLRGRDFFSFEISLYFSKYFSLHLVIFILLRSPLITFKLKLDCEQSLLFFRFREQCTRAGAAKRRDARNEGGLSRLAPSVTRVVICVSRVCSTDYRKKRDCSQSKLKPVCVRYFCQSTTLQRCILHRLSLPPRDCIYLPGVGCRQKPIRG